MGFSNLWKKDGLKPVKASMLKKKPTNVQKEINKYSKNVDEKTDNNSGYGGN